MKTLTLIFSLLLLASCNDALRTRKGICKNADNQNILCSNSDALTVEKFRKMYIAEITTPISVGQTQIIMKDHVQDSDHDQELVCDLEISANKQFAYSIEDKKLVLQDGISTLRFDRTSDPTATGLVGSWVMQDRVGNVLTVTELIFKDLEEIRIRKTCNLK